MIKPNELRIGNWVEYEGRSVQVESINPLNEIVEYGLRCSIQIKEWLTDKHYTYNGRWLNHLIPIPLTPEWLQKCGFVNLNSNTTIGRYYVAVPSIGDELNTEIAFWPNSSMVSINTAVSADGEAVQYTEQKLPHIKYLHQLQNLYFALTGSELEIKINELQ